MISPRSLERTIERKKRLENISHVARPFRLLLRAGNECRIRTHLPPKRKKRRNDLSSQFLRITNPPPYCLVCRSFPPREEFLLSLL